MIPINILISAELIFTQGLKYSKIIFLWIEGSMKYNKGSFQYTQHEMTKIVKKMENTIILCR
jgi:hypothetical protein